MPVAPVTDLGQAVVTSFAAALAMLFAGIPKILAFLIVLAIGWIIASAIAGVVARLLRAIHFNEAAARAGLAGFVARMGLRMDASEFFANIVKWFVRLVVLVVAFDALGLPAVSQILQSFLLWIPNLIVALAVLVIGGLAANALSKLVRGTASGAQLGNPDLLATITQIVVWAFAVLVAINQIGVATTLVNELFVAIVGAFALALGLAFGLGGRETAARMLEGWYDGSRSRMASPRPAQPVRDEMGREHVPAGGNGRTRIT